MRCLVTGLRLLLPLLVSLLIAACSDDNPASSTSSIDTASTPVIAAAAVETERLNTWLDAQYEEQLDFSPQTRTVLGEKTDNDKLNYTHDES